MAVVSATPKGDFWAILVRNLAAGSPRQQVANGGEDRENIFSFSQLLKEAIAGASALRHECRSSWWTWNGSTLFFWRWPDPRQRLAALRGIPVRVAGRFPRNRRKQRPPAPDKRALVASKLDTVRDRGYVGAGNIVSLTDYFDVPKGESDIRMVYNVTSSGLNNAIWAPPFWLPTAASALRCMTFESFCVDLDLGEMFLNFPLDEDLRPFAGIDLTPVQEFLDDYKDSGRTPRTTLWEWWTRVFMGLKASPYNAICHYYWAEELARGPPDDATSPLRYDKVVLNLPGAADYDPTNPRVQKINNGTGKVAGDLTTFVDDLRAMGPSPDQAWLVARRIASRLQHLGIQDAPRKRRAPSQNPAQGPARSSR